MWTVGYELGKRNPIPAWHRPAANCNRKSKDNMPKVLTIAEKQKGTVPFRGSRAGRREVQLPSLRLAWGRMV